MTAGASTFVLKLRLKTRVSLDARTIGRDGFYAWVWREFTARGLLGVHEGTLLSAEAAEQGLETESWTVDSGEAPRERDWVGHQSETVAELHFSSRKSAEAARARIAAAMQLEVSSPEELVPRDWDAEWKASFLASPEGVRVPPIWRIVPPWVSPAPRTAGEQVLKINPGAGFGTGTHETTQLCLRAIAETHAHRSLQGQGALDFGSGSGILAIGLAKLGARVTAVEIDPLAIENAVDNAKMNDVDSGIEYLRELPVAVPYRIVVANILRPVLLEFANRLVERLETSQGAMVLSGLIDRDVAEVRARFAGLLGGKMPKEYASGEWRALAWSL